MQSRGLKHRLVVYLRNRQRRKARKRVRPSVRAIRRAGVLFLVLILLAAGLGYGAWRYAVSLIRRPAETTTLSGATALPTYTTLPPTYTVPPNRGIMNILLLGVDDRRVLNGETYENSDVMMIATIDMDNNVVKLTSVQRDLAVYIPGHEEPEKLTEAHGLGGAALTMQTLNENFRLNLTDYVEVNIYDSERLIDLMGGVDMEVDLSENDNMLFYINECIGNQNVWFPESGESAYLTQGGMQHLNGRQAVAYARVRRETSDYRRMGRQRAVLQALFTQFMDAGLKTKTTVMREGLKCVYTNLSNDEIDRLAFNVFQSMSKQILQKQVPDPAKYGVEFFESRTDYMIRADLNGIIPGLYGFLYNDDALPFDPVREIPGAPNAAEPLPPGLYYEGQEPAPTNVPTAATEPVATTTESAAPTTAETTPPPVGTTPPAPTESIVPTTAAPAP